MVDPTIMMGISTMEVLAAEMAVEVGIETVIMMEIIMEGITTSPEDRKFLLLSPLKWYFNLNLDLMMSVSLMESL